MSAIINGHQLTRPQTRTLDYLQDYLRLRAGDTAPDPFHMSPRGDGRWVSLLEIFPRSNRGTAARRTVVKLHRLGVLRPCQIAYAGGHVKLVPLGGVKEAEAAGPGARAVAPAVVHEADTDPDYLAF